MLYCSLTLCLLRCSVAIPPYPQSTLPTTALQALAFGGGQSQAFSAAFGDAVSRGGCGAVENVLAVSQGIAESSGRGTAFTRDVSRASAEAAKCLRLPNCGDQLASRKCCTQ
jgi:hypothetical protein